MFCLLLPIQTFRGRWSLDLPLWQKLESVMFMMAALILWLAPAYYLAFPKHLYGLFAQASSSTIRTANLILLPFYFTLVVISLLLNQRSLLTVFHMVISVTYTLGYRSQLNNLVMIVACGLSLWLLPRTHKTVKYHLIRRLQSDFLSSC